MLEQLGLPFSYVRIQSTACEQHRFEHLMNDLDADLLINLALGRRCLVWDYGSRSRRDGVPKALWYGIEFIKYALRRQWLGRCQQCWLRGRPAAKQFERYVTGFSDLTKRCACTRLLNSQNNKENIEPHPSAGD
eukprot:jgi/Astpho2/9942/Aster-x0879